MEISGIARKVGLLWLLVPAIAAAEVFLQWSIPGWVPGEDDWRAAAESVMAQKQEGDLVVIAPRWATQGYMYLGPAISMEDFGRFGISNYSRVIEVSARGERAPETEGLDLESEERFGKLEVRRFRTEGKADVVYDFLASWDDARVEGGKKWGKKLIIDHWFNPRFTFPVPLKPAKKAVSVVFEDVPLGDFIWGHGVIGYREGRFDKGGPVELEVLVDDRKVGAQIIHNLGPLETFEFPVEGAGSAKVTFRVDTSGGNYKREFGLAAQMRRGRP